MRRCSTIGCTFLIKECLDSLTETEARLARYLLDHTSEVTHMNAKEFAAACASSPAAVVRFSQKLGFTGFPELKLDLAGESFHEEADAFQTVVRDNDDMEAIIRKMERIHLRNTTLTYQMASADWLSKAVEMICAARRIQLFGVGTSGLLALDFLYKSSCIGIPAFYHADAHTNLAAASLLGQEDTVIAISYTGETKETVLAAKTAKARGAKVITITQANRNALARLADISLYIPNEERAMRVGTMTSRTSGLLILDLLYLGIVKHDPARTQENLAQARETIRVFQED